jgi:S-adenosylmethionine uptake transporter
MSNLSGESLKIISIILVGWTLFAFADAMAKFLSASYHPSLLLVCTGTLGTLSLSGYILAQRGPKGFMSPRWKWLMARAVCVAATATGVVNAVAHIPLSDLYGITFTAPFFAVCMALVFLKEEVGLHRWLAVIIGFAGVLILLGPQFQTFNIGLVYAIIAALSIALGTIVIRKVGKVEYLPLFILYPTFAILLVNLPIAAQHLEVPDIAGGLGILAQAACVMVAQFCTTYAIAHAKSTASVAPFVYIQVVWGVVIGYTVFGDLPSWSSATGLLLVVGAGLYMIFRERQLNKRPLTRVTR